MKIISEPVLGGTVETALSLQVLKPLMLLLERSAVSCEFNQQAPCMYLCLNTFIPVIEACLYQVLLL